MTRRIGTPAGPVGSRGDRGDEDFFPLIEKLRARLAEIDRDRRLSHPLIVQGQTVTGMTFRVIQLELRGRGPWTSRPPIGMLDCDPQHSAGGSRGAAVATRLAVIRVDDLDGGSDARTALGSVWTGWPTRSTSPTPTPNSSARSWPRTSRRGGASPAAAAPTPASTSTPRASWPDGASAVAAADQPDAANAIAADERKGPISERGGACPSSGVIRVR